MSMHGAHLPNTGFALRWRMLIRPVASLPRAVAFYRDALGFEPLPEPRSRTDRLLAACAFGEADLAAEVLELGEQHLVLVQDPRNEHAAAFDAGPLDPAFQHMALVVEDMASAWQHVRQRAAAHPPLSQGGPQRLPPASGGVTAWKFRDPDGHPLELLAFPEGHWPPHWKDAVRRSPSAPALGIDHTAIGTRVPQDAVRFYEELLGLTLTSRHLNEGVEQQQLDGLASLGEARVEVIGLAPAHATPHLELLGYRAALAHPPHARGLGSFTVFEVQGLEHIARRARQELALPKAAVRPPGRVALAHDPDGHALLLWEPPRPAA